jgi:glycosyltransferase involved in cell wall biosynthesis
MAAGLPIVADAVGQNTEYVQSGISGVLIPPGDVEAMVAAVVDLLRDPAHARATLGQAAARRVHAEFGWDRLVGEVERAYAEPAIRSVSTRTIAHSQ